MNDRIPTSRLIRGEDATAAQPIKRGLIDCELNDLASLAAELEVCAQQLVKKLGPVMDQRETPPEPNPCKPEVMLPEVGDRIRNARRTIAGVVDLLRLTHQRVEI